MASWITHLRVAEQFRDEFQNEQYKDFLIGNIAPDSGMLNDDKLTYTPPAEVSHYIDKNIPVWGNVNLNFYKKYVSSFKPDKINNEIAFKLGYFIHLFLDNLWGFYIHKPTKHRYKDEFESNPQFIWEVKLDWYGIDQEFLADNKDWDTWKIFNTLEYSQDYLDFYPQKAINQKLEYIKEFYNYREKIQRPYKYLLNEEMDKFIDLSVYWIRIGLKELFSKRKITESSIMNILEDNFGSFKNRNGNLDFDYMSNIQKKEKFDDRITK